MFQSMTSSISSCLSACLIDQMPPEGLMNKILHPQVTLACNVHRGREAATAATLQLRDVSFERSYENFQKWVRGSDSPLPYPVITLLRSQLNDLICKVYCAALFYHSFDKSLYVSLTSLFARSEKISRIIQPILKRVALVPIPQFLKSVHVIAFAPIILKLTHIALLYAHSKWDNKYLEKVKTATGKCATSLEFLLHLRYSLLYLSVAKTLYKSVLSATYCLLMDRYTSTAQIPWTGLPSWCRPPPYLLPRILGYFAEAIVVSAPVDGLYWGIAGMLGSLQASSEPCDMEVLKTLYDEVEESFHFEDKTPEEFEQKVTKESLVKKLTRLKKEIEVKKAHIMEALQAKKINDSYATALNMKVDVATQQTLVDQALKLSLIQFNIFGDAELKPLLLQIYFPQTANGRWTNIDNLLFTMLISYSSTKDSVASYLKPNAPHIFRTPLEQLEKDFKSVLKLSRDGDITQLQEQSLKNLLFEGSKYGFTQQVIPDLKQNNIQNFSGIKPQLLTYLDMLQILYPDKQEEIQGIRGKINAFAVENEAQI
jgi:hypothetical protein